MENNEDFIKNSITLEELDAKWKARRKWRDEHYVQSFFISCWEFFKWTLPRVIDDAIYETKWGFQRMFRGYDDTELWSYPYQNARKTLIVLRWLRENKHGIPGQVCEDGETFEQSQLRWDELLDKMIAGFQAFLDADEVHIVDKQGEYDSVATHLEWNRLNKIWEEGAALYIKYYGNLWD